MAIFDRFADAIGGVDQFQINGIGPVLLAYSLFGFWAWRQFTRGSDLGQRVIGFLALCALVLGILTTLRIAFGGGV